MKKLLLLAASALMLTSCSTKSNQTANDSTGTVDSTSDTATMVANVDSAVEQKAPDTSVAESAKSEESEKTEKAETPLNMKDIVTAVKGRVFNFSKNTATSTMTGLGFTSKGSSNTTYENDYGDMESAVKMKFAKGNINADVLVSTNSLKKITITFPNANEAKEFVDNSKKAFGKSLKAQYSGYTYKENITIWFMTQKGNKIEIEAAEDMG